MNGHIRKRVMPKTGAIRYYPVIVVEGKRHQLGGFGLKKDAQASLRKAQWEIAEGTYGIKPKADISLGEFYQGWIESKARSTKASTLADYRRTFKHHILPVLGDKDLRHISADDIQGWVNGLAATHLSPASVGKTYRYLRTCINNALDKDRIDRSPCRGVILPRVERVEYQLLTTSEVTSLLEVAEEPERTLFALLAYSGLRLGEGLGLKWKDIDFEKRCIRVERTWGEFGWTTPKTTSSRRAVPLSPTLAVMLKDYQTARGATSPDNVVFSHDGTRPLDPGNVRREFYKALEAADLKHVSLHSLRHFFASVMLASGCSIKFLQHSLGHASATMTLNVYSHLIPESAGEAVLRFDELISNEVVQLKAIAGVGNRD